MQNPNKNSKSEQKPATNRKNRALRDGPAKKRRTKRITGEEHLLFPGRIIHKKQVR
jgi:hypothetical protein